MKTIKLHGVLADKFGETFKLAVESAHEATHAIACQMPEFKKFMIEAEQNGMRFAVFMDDKNISEDEVYNASSAKTVHIVPRVMGAGGVADILQVVVGAIMVGVGVFASGITAGTSTFLIGTGLGLMMGGIASMLMPTPDMGDQDEDGNRANNGFGGAVTTVAQGNPVPVLYGERYIGGFIMSAGIFTEDNQ